MANTTDFNSSYARYQADTAIANRANKTSFFDALDGTGITSITVSFDGEGDSGQIEDINAWSQDAECPLPDTFVRLLRADWGSEAETIFGATITLSTGRVVPTRWVGEQHVREDLGFIPSFADWVKAIRPEPWMGRTEKLEETLTV